MTLVARHAALSDIGLHRTSNEDSCLAEPPLFILADGMGGAQAGEVASQAAVAAVCEALAGGSSLLDAAKLANTRVYELAAESKDRTGMGTTLTALRLAADGDGGEVVHVGDSRLYRLRDGQIERLSTDHSLVGQWLREGSITPDEAAVSRYRSVLTRALGTEPEVEFDSFAIDTRAGDRLLLCSDGLSGLVGEDVIVGILGQGPPEVAARELVHEAKSSGGFDNVTVVVVRLDDVEGGGDEVGAGEAAGAVAAATAPAASPASGSHDAKASVAPAVPAGIVEAPAAARRSRRRHRWLVAALIVALAVLVVAVLVLTGTIDVGAVHIIEPVVP